MDKTATQILEDARKTDRLAARDRNICRSSAAAAVAEAEERLRGDEHKYRAVAHEIAERAAYLAIQADREMHQHEIDYLDKTMGLHIKDIMTRPASQIVWPKPPAK